MPRPRPQCHHRGLPSGNPMHVKTRLAVALLLACTLHSASALAQQHSLEGVNFTGPLITPNPAGMAAGQAGLPQIHA